MGLNSGLYAFMAGLDLTEPSPQPSTSALYSSWDTEAVLRFY